MTEPESHWSLDFLENPRLCCRRRAQCADPSLRPSAGRPGRRRRQLRLRHWSVSWMLGVLLKALQEPEEGGFVPPTVLPIDRVGR